VLQGLKLKYAFCIIFVSIFRADLSFSCSTQGLGLFSSVKIGLKLKKNVICVFVSMIRTYPSAPCSTQGIVSFSSVKIGLKLKCYLYICKYDQSLPKCPMLHTRKSILFKCKNRFKIKMFICEHGWSLPESSMLRSSLNICFKVKNVLCLVFVSMSRAYPSATCSTKGIVSFSSLKIG
jgi:hypothetical protein